MFDFSTLLNLGKRTPQELTNAEIAELIGASPEALKSFTEAYEAFEDSGEPSDNLFKVNSRQAARGLKISESSGGGLVDRIAQELLETPSSGLITDGVDEDSDGSSLVTNDDLKYLPLSERPQLTGRLVQCDIEAPSYPVVVSMLKRARESVGKAREQFTLQALAMMDTLDLDPVVYLALSKNPAAMGNWLPALEDAVRATDAFLLPKTVVKRVPLPILQLTRLDYFSLTPMTFDIVDAWAREAFSLDPAKDYFIKTGTFSSKFDFRNARVSGPDEVREIGRYLTYIHFQANQMASPLNQPGPIAGVSTTNEWVVREWIEDESGSPTIYHGMPLRTEFRVFVDCDRDTVLAVVPYWDPEVMLERFERQEDALDPDMRHDAIVFRSHQATLMERFERFKGEVIEGVNSLLPYLDLSGQWSLDVMLNDTEGDQLYAIDMAPAASSAFYEHVSEDKRNPMLVDWLPDFASIEK